MTTLSQPLSITIPSTVRRVEDNTDSEINLRIEVETMLRVQEVASGGNYAITRRLQELDREWDIERLLETNAAAVTLASLGLGIFVSRKFFVMPFIVAGFLLQHAVQGWCPPLPVLRRLGIRTPREIELERTALRILRGDFNLNTTDPREAMAMARTQVMK